MENKFIGSDVWKFDFPNSTKLILLKDEEVLVLRSLLFFYKGEKTTLSKIKEHFTDHAIEKLIYYEFLKIKK